MTDERPKRRDEDSGVAKIVHFAPLIGSIVLTLFSIGGYITTIRYMGDHQVKQDSIIEDIQKTQGKQIEINSRLTTLQEVTTERLKSIEDWRNGVNDIYITTPRHKSRG